VTLTDSCNFYRMLRVLIIGLLVFWLFAGFDHVEGLEYYTEKRKCNSVGKAKNSVNLINENRLIKQRVISVCTVCDFFTNA